MLNRITCFLLAVFIVGCSSDPSGTSQKNNQDKLLAVKSDSLIGKLKNSFSRDNSSLGQTIYVPVYSHIYQQNHEMTFNLTATLSIRNADLINSFTLKSVMYYDSKGKMVKNYLEAPVAIKPLASSSYVVEEDDLRGGVGANFIVVWETEEPVSPPVVEAVMISTSQQQGISFVSAGRVLENKNPDSLPSRKLPQ